MDEPVVVPNTTPEAPTPTVSIDTYTPEITQATREVSIDARGRPYQPPMDPELARLRAFKAAYGLNDVIPKSEQEIYQSMSSGYEDIMRNQVALEMDQKKGQLNKELLLKLNDRYNMSPAQFDTAVAALDTKPTNPESVFDKAYGKRYLNSIDEAADKHDSFVPNVKQSLPEAFKNIKEVGTDIVAKQQFLRRLGQDIIQNDVASQSWLGWGADQVKQMLQPYVEWKQRGNVPGVSPFSGFFLGNNLEEQSMALFRMPIEDMMKATKAFIEPMRKDNPTLAAQTLMTLAGQTGDEKFLNNMFTLMMPVDIAGIGIGFKDVKNLKKPLTIVTTDKLSGKVLEQKVLAAAKDVVASSANEPHTVQTITAAAGDLQTSGIKQAAEAIDSHIKGNLDEAKVSVEAMTSNFRLDKDHIREYGKRALTKGQEVANRLLQAYDRKESAVQQAIIARQNINKLPGVFESEAAVAELEGAIRNSGEFKGLPSAVADVEFIYKKVPNEYGYNVIITNHHGQLFDQPETAHAFAKLYGLTVTPADIVRIDSKNAAGEVVQQGIGYKIVLHKPLKSTDSVVQNLLIPTTHETEPEGWLRSWIGWALNPDETLSSAHREARKVAAYGPSHLMKVAQADARMITSFARGAIQVNPLTGKTEKRQFSGMNKRYGEWERMIKALRTAEDPDNVGQKGRWLKDPGEVSEYYQTHYFREPEEAEVASYFAYKRINEYDRVLRDLRQFSNMWRMGAQHHSFSYIDEAGITQKFPAFTGMTQNHVPKGEGTVLFMGDGKMPTRMYDASRPGTFNYKDWTAGVQEGRYKVIKLYNPEERPFANWGPVKDDNWVQYVIVNNIESKNIPFNLLPRRGGGHWDVDAPFYIKQAKVYFDNPTKASGKTGFRHVYAGDVTVMPIQIRRMGEDISKHLNEIRLLIAGKDMEGAKQYLRDHPIGVEWKDVVGWFSTRTVDGKKLRPMLALDQEIKVVPKDKKIVDMNKDLEKKYTHKLKDGSEYVSFRDGTKTGNPAAQSQIQYTGMRDAEEVWTINDYGSRYNPLFAYEQAKMVDPIESMNRALAKITQSTYLEDYKQFAVSHWLAEAKDYLTKDIKETIATPYHSFQHPVWASGVDEDIKRRLMASNWNIRQFLGVTNPIDTMIKSTVQKLLDNMYGKFGPKSVQLMPEWLLHGTQDPVQFVKQVTYHAALGLFSIPQLVVQAQTMALTAALSPKAFAAGLYGSMLHQWARVNPKMVDALDRWATKLSLPGLHDFKPGEWKEARELFTNSGFFHVQGEYAAIDDIMNGNKLVKGLGKEFLEWGTTPFKGGERQVRMTAGYTAYVEWRRANPVGRITDKEASVILNRADDLYANMSRASSSALHSGVFGVTTQFLSYQLRVAELFLGSRTNIADKARMFGVFSALYGVPMAGGLTGVPLGDYLKKKALEEGYVVGDNWITSLINEGIPAIATAYLTGGGDIKKGNWYNFGDRYGVQGFEFMRDFWRGDKNIMSIIGGAAGSKIAGVIASADPFYQFIMSGIRNEEGAFKIKSGDFLGPLQEISSINNAWRTIAAINTGRFMSKHGIYLDDVSPINAFMMGITGLQPQRVTDLNTLAWSQKDRDELEKWAEKKFKENWHQALRIAKDQPDDAKDFFKRAFTYLWIGGIRDDKVSNILASASQDNLSLVNQIDWSYYVAKAPKDQQQKMYEALGRKQMVKQ